jgi:hypothetical protein
MPACMRSRMTSLASMARHAVLQWHAHAEPGVCCIAGHSTALLAQVTTRRHMPELTATALPCAAAAARCAPLQAYQQCGGMSGPCGAFCKDSNWRDRCCPVGQTCTRSDMW